jgi:hypothetical protein
MTNALVEVGNAIINPINHIWNNLVAYLPGLIGAIIVALIGYLLGILFGRILEKLLIKWKLDEWVKKNDFSHILLDIKLSQISGQLLKWGIFVAFLAPAASLLRLNSLETIITQFALWIPGLIFAIIITIVGLILAKSVAKNIHISKNHKFAKSVADIIQTIIIILVLDIALKQIGVQLQFIETIILIIIGAVVLALALAFGISLAGSLRKYSDQLVETIIHKDIKNSKKK